MILHLLLYSLFLGWWSAVDAGAANRTIDDTSGDSVTGAKPTYQPADTWDGPSCSPAHCKVIPSPDQAFGNTYSAALYVPGGGARTIQFSFKGIDIYVFFIQANYVGPNIWTETFCKFVLDGQESDFHHTPSQNTAYDYNTLVYSRHNLPNVDHTLIISADGYITASYLIFDYAIYTFDGGAVFASSVGTTPQTPTALVTQVQLSGITIPPRTITTVISGITVSTRVTDISNFDSTGQSSTSFLNSASTPSSLTVAGNNDPDTGGAPAHGSRKVIGGIIGSLSLLILIIYLLHLWRRRKLVAKSSPKLSSAYPILRPFTPETPTTQNSWTFGQKRNGLVGSDGGSSQNEINHRMSELTSEVRGTGSGARPAGGTSNSWDASEVSRMVEENTLIKAQVEQLHAQLQSGWALGPLNEPPPGYSRH